MKPLNPDIILSRESSRSVDRLAAAEFGMPTIALMENAARAAADVAAEMCEPAAGVLVVAGPGNNGGDGLAMARHLDNSGRRVSIALLREPRPATDAAINCTIVRAMGLPISRTVDAALAALPVPLTLVVDAIFGTGLTRAPDGEEAAAIERINALRAAGKKVLAVDIPSGLDCDTGRPLGATVRADVTVTFVARKLGFLVPGAGEFLGRVVVADIGVPNRLVERLAGGGMPGRGTC